MLYTRPPIPEDIGGCDQQICQDLLDLLQENEGIMGVGKPKFKPRSRAMPPLTLSPAVHTFFSIMCNEINQLGMNRNASQNITRAEQLAITRLQNDRTFVIKEADKGGNVVVWPVKMYSQEAYSQLHDQKCYAKLPSDPTFVFKLKLDRLLMAAKNDGIIQKQEFNFLTVEDPVIPTFYILPKVHKNATKPPGRPIVAGIGGLCEKPCIFVDHFLQPLVLQLPSYLRESTSVLQEFGKLKIDGDYLLVTCDVEALYPDIQQHHGMRAVTYFLDKKDNSKRMLDSFVIDQ